MKKYIPLFFTLLSVLSVANAQFDTTFSGGNANDVLNWSAGFPESGDTGLIAVDGSWANDSGPRPGWNITQNNDADMTGNSIFASDSIYLIESGSLTSRRLSLTGTTQLTMTGGTLTVTDRSGGQWQSNTQVTVNGASAVMSVNVNKTLAGTFTLEQGTVNNLELTTGSTALFNINGGSFSTDLFNSTNGGTVTFGGSTDGTFTLNTGAFTAGATFNWLTGSLIDFSIAGADQTFYEGLYTANQLQFEGSNAGAFGDNFLVSGETLTLIPEPSTFALLGLAGLAVFALRRRR